MRVTPEQAVKEVSKYKSVTEAARKMGIPKSTLQLWCKKVKLPEKTRVKHLSEFREKYDKSYYIPKKVRAALSLLGQGWEYEAEFARLAGVSLLDLGTVREQFVAHIVTIGRDSRRAWAGSKLMAEEMRRML